MKKFFSLIALVGVFAACEPEELRTIFTSAPAQLTIKVGKVYNAVDGKDLTAVATKDADVVIAGTPAIAANSQVMHASYGGVTGSVTVDYPSILADTDPVTITAADIWIPGNKNNYKIEVREGSKASETKKYGLLSAENHGVSYTSDDWDGKWLENANDYILVDTYTWKEYSGSELIKDDKGESCLILDDIFEADVKLAAAAKDNDKITYVEKEDEIQVSAWALYNVINAVTTTITTWEVVATPDPAGSAPIPGNDGVVGTFYTKSILAIPTKVEAAHPSHNSHYEAGKGNGTHHGGHGDGSNAGGGFADAE